ncbi:MAG: hydantoinase/oxoprolinase family protein, partial [Desulfobulbaceae bacterium]|nr:hydantoinase/oxoprolinase family protein [Desulfobulbaceae bacterium]
TTPERDEILEYLREHGPATPFHLSEKTRWKGISLDKHLQRLHYQQHITIAGFTPTDVLHLLNKISIGKRVASVTASTILAERLGTTVEELGEKIVRLTEQKIEKIIMEYLGQTIWGEGMVGAVLDNRQNELFDLDIALKIPMIGIGAAAAHFLPGVAQHLKAKLHLPKHFEVGNGVGAALLARIE